MIVDLDAHQGNGYARDLMCDNSVYIFDVFNRNVFPQDGYAKRAIKKFIISLFFVYLVIVKIFCYYT